jgi:murein DD-endopeptidase MepM/ murein hydrolase activator NlpD
VIENNHIKYISNKLIKTTQAVVLGILIGFFKFFILLLKGVQIIVLTLGRPAKSLLRVFFYKFVVKFYSSYLSIVRKLGWSSGQGNTLAFFTVKQLLNIIIFIIVVIIVINNLSPKTYASDLQYQNSKPIVTNIIHNEFGDQEDNYLIEEKAIDPKTFFSPAGVQENSSFLREDFQASTNKEDEDVNNNALSSEGTAIIKNEIASTAGDKKARIGIIYYTVQSGDSISTIAQQYDISVNTVLWENNLTVYSFIKPGQELAILPFTGVSYTVAKGDNLSAVSKKFGIDGQKILEVNSLVDANQLKIGQKILIPGGARLAAVVPKTTSYSGISAVKELINAPSAAPAAGNKMNWPTVGYRITQYFSWRHTGLDIANKIGTPLYAADAGTIEFAGWRKGYGNFVIINHGGGKVTRYGHLSKFYCEKGDKVAKGEVIGAMGSTGNSTGPHLHFEVIINGVKYNPLNYIK